METRETLKVENLVISGVQAHEVKQTILQDAGRTTVLKHGTVMGRIATSGKWKPWVNTATDGSALAVGIYDGEDIPAATLVAGDITGNVILVGQDIIVNENVLVIEGGLTLATVIGTGVTTTTLREQLRVRGIETTKATELYTGAY